MDERLNLPSASSFYADVACPGRQNLLRQLREQNVAVEIDNPSLAELAERGTRIHRARATGDTTHLLEDELEAYQKACALEREIVQDWMRDRKIDSISDPIIEERLWLNDQETLMPRLSGQLDVIHLAGQNALICDWKTNMAYYAGDVGKSWPMRIYALLAWKEWPQLKNIRLAFIKPEAFGPKKDVADVSESDLTRIEQATLTALWWSAQPDAPRHPGTQCVWCPCKPYCDDAARYSMVPISAATATGLTTKEDIETAVSLMPIESAATVWKKRKIVETIMDAIEARLKALPDDALSPLGLARKEGRKMDEIADNVGAFNALRADGFTSEQILECMKLSKGAAVAMLQADSNVSKAKAEAEYEELLGEFIERSRAKPSLVETKL